MESKRKGTTSSGSGSNFQMPLHYPKYTKEDYQNLPEWMLDRLLAEYGLSTSTVVNGDLALKREFAMGAFLWPNHHQSTAQPTATAHRRPNPNSSGTIFPSLESFLRKKRV